MTIGVKKVDVIQFWEIKMPTQGMETPAWHVPSDTLFYLKMYTKMA